MYHYQTVIMLNKSHQAVQRKESNVPEIHIIAPRQMRPQALEGYDKISTWRSKARESRFITFSFVTRARIWIMFRELAWYKNSVG